MTVFRRIGDSPLYETVLWQPGAAWWGFVLAPAAKEPPFELTLSAALENTELAGSFVNTLERPELEKAGVLDALIEQVRRLAQATAAGRAVIWLTAAGAPEQAPVPVLAISHDGRRVVARFSFDLSGVGRLFATVRLDTELSAEGTDLVLVNEQAKVVELTGAAQPVTSRPSRATVAFAGPEAGVLAVDLAIERRSLDDLLNWGFQYFAPNHDAGAPNPWLTAWMSLTAGGEPNPGDMLPFAARFAPADPNNRRGSLRTLFWFARADTELVSWFRTSFGAVVSLYPRVDAAGAERPAALVVDPGVVGETQAGFRFSPVGDFALALPAGAGTTGRLLCGLAGAETIDFTAGGPEGDRLRFTAGRAACAPRLPIPEASPLGPPFEADAPLLAPTFVTSWATVVPAPAAAGRPHYAAAPEGADPFGKDPVVHSAAGLLLGPRDPGSALENADLAFPMVPYAGLHLGDGSQELTAEQVEMLERQILSPTRRRRITAAAGAYSGSAAATRAGLRAAAGAERYDTTTPAGLVATVDGGRYAKLLLGQVGPPGAAEPDRQVAFLDLQRPLQDAFQTSDLMLVVANAAHLGAFLDRTGVVEPDGTPRFANVLELGGWRFALRVGEGQTYGRYRNVMIVKGVRGRLVDLVESPDKWTAKGTFAAPSNGSAGSVTAPQAGQLLPLSQWLSAYFAAALARDGDPYFQTFNRIIRSEAWTGILLLAVDIAGVPRDLAGMLAGVNDPSSFLAHHLGIEISQVDAETVRVEGSSSVFGLIDYTDPAFDPVREAPVAPAELGATYDFTLLTLRVLFENSAVKRFQSLAQAALNELFGSAVSHMGEGGNLYNAILLRGALQRNGETPVYSLASSGTNLFHLANDVLLRVQVDAAQLTTRDDGAASGQVVSWLGMSGSLAFAELRLDEAAAFDLFSFGSAGGTEVAGQGLAFANLGLVIAYPKSDPARRLLRLAAEEIGFDTGASHARPDSLFRSFQLELQGLVSGSAEESPADRGFLTLGTPQRPLGGVAGRRWHGLVYGVNLGTPGALASKVNLTSTLLTAWADDSGAEGDTRAVAGLRLPGAGGGSELFSLQTVISVSVGTPRLFYNAEKKAFLLLLGELALKFLGLLKLPPNGATSFFLFGGPEVEESSGLGWLAVYNQDQPKSTGGGAGGAA